jgi:hypothetical protein
MRENNTFPSKLDFALIGILAISSCQTPKEHTPPRSEITPIPAPTTEVTHRPIPTIGPAVLALRGADIDRGVGR